VDLLGGSVDHTIPANRSGTVTRTTIWEFLGDVVQA
jgi:hypothetical protein